ncbi:hypothetical protein Tco_0429001 [Tanacetum coccineum]
MAALKFADTHNMVAFLEKPTESIGFEEIVDFLNAHLIRYALTVNPTIYVSCIEQIWSTAKPKTINDKTQIHALVDGKKIVITESSVRRDLQFADELFLVHLVTLRRKPKRKNTKVPQPSGSTDNVADEAVLKEKGNSLERAATTASSLEAEQVSGNIYKTQSKETFNEPNPQGTGSGSGPWRQDTMEDIIAQTRKLKAAQAQEITRLKLRVKKLEKKGGLRAHKLKRLYKIGRSARVISFDDDSLGDQEDASKQGRKISDIDKDADVTLIDETQGRYGEDLMFDTCVLDDEEVFAGQDMAEQEINVAEKEVSTVDPITTTGEEVTTASVEVSIASPTATTTADDLTLAEALMEIRSARPKAKGISFREPDESTTITTSTPTPIPSKIQDKAELEEEERLLRQREKEANIASWDNVQAMMDADYQMAQQMQAEEQEELTIEEKSKLFVQLLEARKKYFAALRAKEKRNKPPTKTQREIQCLLI